MGKYHRTLIKVTMPKNYGCSWRNDRDRIFEFRAKKLVDAFEAICTRAKLKYEILEPKSDA